MTGRKHVAALVAGATLAATGGSASAATTSLHNCGAISAGGRSWLVASTVIACPVAADILKTLASEAPASGFHRIAGTFAGMKCNSIVGAGRHAFQCSSRDGRTTLTALSH